MHPKVYETIKRLEGLPRNRDPGLRYKNIRGIGTIGYGHMITPQSPALFRRLFGSKFDAEAVVRGKKPLTKAQYERLLEHDVDVRVDQVRDRLPNYDTWPPRVQTAVMQAKFRGDLGPQTTRHLKEGDFKAAAQEIVRTSEYRRPGNEGITRRLDEAAGAFRNYAEKPVPAPAPTPAPAPVARKRMRNRVANVGRAVQKRTSELGTQAQRMAKRAETHVREERARLPARQRDWSKRVNEARKRGENAATAVARRARPMMDQTAARVRDFGDQVRRRARNARAELDRRTKPLRNRVERTGLPRA